MRTRHAQPGTDGRCGTTVIDLVFHCWLRLGAQKPELDSHFEDGASQLGKLAEEYIKAHWCRRKDAMVSKARHVTNLAEVASRNFYSKFPRTPRGYCMMVIVSSARTKGTPSRLVVAGIISPGKGAHRSEQKFAA